MPSCIAVLLVSLASHCTFQSSVDLLYVSQKMAKVKASDKLSFPLKLDLAPVLAVDSASQPHGRPQQDTNYELMSILIHKGSSASHGHYGNVLLSAP